MSESLRGVVVTHGAMADALLRAVRTITGDADGLVAISNDDTSATSLTDRIVAAASGGPTLVFVDLPGGSCFQAAARCFRGRSDVAVVAGVNLAMLLDFVYHRDEPPADAATRAVETGVRAIRVLPR